MARLNEPPVSTDNFDALRRRLLRQNRDIARVNSNQSLRIRGLENECARLLSENLDLRGRVLHLEKELEDNSSQRIADHALQVKHKMEAQLFELGALLAGLGVEPPTKRLSLTQTRKASTARLARLNLEDEAASPSSVPLPRKPPILSPYEAENLALQEGRLPPIYENKVYPRQILTRDELTALRSTATSADQTVESMVPPQLPSAPETQPASPRKPSSKTTSEQTTPRLPKPTTSPVEQPAHVATTTKPNKAKHRTDSEMRNSSSAEPTDSKHPTVPAAQSSLTVTTPIAAKTGAKRKYAMNDENTATRGVQQGTAANANACKSPASMSKCQTQNSTPVRELKNPKSIRDFVNSRNKEAKGNNNGARAPPSARRPLGVKSTNEDISSPRKGRQGTVGDKPMKPGSEDDRAKPTFSSNSRLRDRMKHQQHQPMTVIVSDLGIAHAPSVVDVTTDGSKSDGDKSKPATPLVPDSLQLATLDLEDTPPSESPGQNSEQAPVCPSTPPGHIGLVGLGSQRFAPANSEGRHDTPPPADISSQGETSRPSRRARASVSYVEPNLRDKMRRPTKELFDAVAGEGKYVQRQQHQSQHDEGMPSSALEARTPHTATKSQFDQEQLQSHLTQQLESITLSQTSVHAATDSRRQSASSTRSGDERRSTYEAAGKDRTEGATSRQCQTGSEQDPYDFIPSSSESSTLGQEGGGSAVTSTIPKSRSTRRSLAGAKSVATSKMTRRSSAVANLVREDVVASAACAADRHTRPSAARKRASMTAMKHGTLFDTDDDGDDPADSSYEPSASEAVSEQGEVAAAAEGQSMSTRDRISRRRSMML